MGAGSRSKSRDERILLADKFRLMQSATASSSDKIDVVGKASMRKIVESAAFDATTLLEIGTTFKRAWAEIEHHFGATDVELARARLAQALVLVAASHDCHDIAGLKTEALQVLALTYRRRWPLNWH